MTTTRFARPLLLVAAAGLALAGCSRSDREETVETDNTTVVTDVPEAVETPEPAPTPTPTIETNAAEPLPEAEPEAPDAQMLDDASATGMTARAQREGREEEAPGNER